MGKMASSIAGSCAVMVLVLLAACTGAGPSREMSSGRSAAPTEASTTSPSPGVPFVRACDSNVYGDLGKDWRDHSAVVGPIAFAGLPFAATAPRSDFTPDNQGYRRVKALAVVERGAEVTVSVPPTEQGHIALVYDPAVFDSGQLADGETAVMFRACAEGEGPWPGPTQFNGGFIVDGPQCATLEVMVGDGPPKRVEVAFGKGTCSSG